MNLNGRSLLGLLPVLAILGGFWYLLLAPARAELSATQAQVVEATSRRDAAVATAAAAELARRSYPSDFASVSRLAQAVPVDEDVAALVRGLDSLARAHKLDFRTIELGEAVPKESAAPEATATDDAAGGEGGEAKGGAAEGAGGGTAGTSSSGEPAGDADAGAGAAGDGAAVPQAPPGAAVGAAGLLTMPFTFAAEGKYLTLQSFLAALHARGRHAGEAIRVDGRLLTIDGFSLLAGRQGFPELGALVSATAYLEPDPGGVIARSTPRGPASALASPAVAPAPIAGAPG